MYAPLVRSDYYGTSVPLGGPRSATDLPFRQTGCPTMRAATSGSHVPCVPIGQDGRPTLPRQPRRAYAADLRRDLLARRLDGLRSRTLSLRAAAHCIPAQIRQIRAGTTLTGLYTLVPRVRLLALLAGPAPSGSADASRRCRGCFPPSPASPGSDCPQLLPGRCDGPTVVVFHLHSVTQNFVAHVGSARGAVLASRPARFPGPPSAPAVPVPEQRALHEPRRAVFFRPCWAMGRRSSCLGRSSG